MLYGQRYECNVVLYSKTLIRVIHMRVILPDRDIHRVDRHRIDTHSIYNT